MVAKYQYCNSSPKFDGYGLKIEMVIAGIIFEPQPLKFAKLPFSQRSLNVFEFFDRYLSTKKLVSLHLHVNQDFLDYSKLKSMFQITYHFVLKFPFEGTKNSQNI